METEFEKDVADLYTLWKDNFDLDTWIKSSDVMAMIEALPHTCFKKLMDRYPGSKWIKLRKVIEDFLLLERYGRNLTVMRVWSSNLKGFTYRLVSL